MNYDAEILQKYLPIAIFAGIATFIALAVVLLPQIFAPKKPNQNKLKPYECGFDPFRDARIKFDIRFYLVAILFIIFDLEIAFLIPWAINLKSIGLFGFFSMMFFLFILTAGFVYEWKKGALEWE